jgi:hypothetical protein
MTSLNEHSLWVEGGTYLGKKSCINRFVFKKVLRHKYFFCELHSTTETLTTQAHSALEHTHANPTPRSIFEDWVGKTLKLTKSPVANPESEVRRAHLPILLLLLLFIHDHKLLEGLRRGSMGFPAVRGGGGGGDEAPPDPPLDSPLVTTGISVSTRMSPTTESTNTVNF